MGRKINQIKRGGLFSLIWAFPSLLWFAKLQGTLFRREIVLFFVKLMGVTGSVSAIANQ